MSAMPISERFDLFAGVKIYLNGQVQKAIVTQDSLHGTILTRKPLLIGRRGNRQD